MHDSEPGHNFLHISRVHLLAKHIAQKEKADLLVVEAAALLHDIGRKYELRNPKINHADKSAEIALSTSFVKANPHLSEVYSHFLFQKP
ncbi:HDIG domain-containing protein, partial [Candidatus Woesearchaeota archaeon]|nr:HDIG domain-containing protein [Candidatus Woesearchaeota archaeon]